MPWLGPLHCCVTAVLAMEWHTSKLDIFYEKCLMYIHLLLVCEHLQHISAIALATSEPAMEGAISVGIFHHRLCCSF